MFGIDVGRSNMFELYSSASPDQMSVMTNRFHMTGLTPSDLSFWI